jgi:transposase InsO family protein
LAVLESIKKFRGYLEATHFEVITDHASLLWLLNKKDPTGRLGRWLLQLQQYDMTLIHRKGKEHVVPDALSRAIVEEIESTSRDKWYVDLIRKVELSPETYPKFQIKQGMLYKFVKCNSELIDSWRLVLPSDSRDKIMKQNHDEKAHLGYTKTINRIKQAYYWPKMYQDVRKYVNSCEICKETKAPNQILRPPMGSARVSSVPWSSISIDFKGPMVRSKSGNTYILVVVDNFSKLVLIHPMKSAEAKRTIKFLHDEVFMKFSVPDKIISDNGPAFKSNEFKKFVEEWKIEHHKTPYYHAQANPVERVNRVIGSAIAAQVKDTSHKTWDETLPAIAAAINSAIHEGHKYTPCEVVFGYKMKLCSEDHAHNLDKSLESKFKSLEVIRKNVKRNLEASYPNYSKRYNLRTRTRALEPNQIVFRRNFKLSDAIRNYSAAIGKKFLKCVVDCRVGTNMYRLKDLNGKILGIFDAKDIKE